jgi:16S rRNA (adenine1518-N6/adenine1519-N6)-dimethyltransferase
MAAGIAPSQPKAHKALGQHWLVDKRYLRRIVEAADIGPEDTVVEVGAGSGLLTELLADVVPRLIAVEVDPRLAEKLQRRFTGQHRVTVLAADVLALPLGQILATAGAGPPYVVMGNLPFFIGTAIVRRFLKAALSPRWLIVTLQAEVAENVCAGLGRMSFLSVEAQYYAEPRLLFSIPGRAFRPPPKVQAAVVRLDVRPRPAVVVDDGEGFFRLVQAGFAAPRKQLANSLALGLRAAPIEIKKLLVAADIDHRRRPETLSLGEWSALYRAHGQAILASGE